MKTHVDKSGHLHVVSQNVIVAGDYHAPLQHDQAVDHMLRYARDHHVKDLVINGDFLNQDAFSKYLPKQKSAGWAEESERARELADLHLMFFDDIAIVLSNHDLRLVKKTDWALVPHDVVRLIFMDTPGKTVVSTAYDHLFMNDDFLICHPDKYSAKPCYLARKFAQRYKKSVIVGHTHLLNHHQEGDRHYIDGGCMTDMDSTEYVQSRTTTFPDWKLGFVHIKDNVPEIISLTEPISIRREW